MEAARSRYGARRSRGCGPRLYASVLSVPENLVFWLTTPTIARTTSPSLAHQRTHRLAGVVKKKRSSARKQKSDTSEMEARLRGWSSCKG